MQKTKIEWCDSTWNPVTGCLHGCEYCYARKMVRRFANIGEESKNNHCLNNCTHCNYPFGFDPTFHKYRLNEPSQIKKPQNVFVCSMADLFGEWVPDDWIEKVFEACRKAPQHRYLFLTKNPARYYKLLGKYIITPYSNMWFGSTLVVETDEYYYSENNNAFLSIEPIQSGFEKSIDTVKTDWIIIGTETGNRKGKIIPERKWIENIVNYCKEKNVPVFMKNSLAKIWQEPLIQEFPWRQNDRI